MTRYRMVVKKHHETLQKWADVEAGDRFMVCMAEDSVRRLELARKEGDKFGEQWWIEKARLHITITYPWLERLGPLEIRRMHKVLDRMEALGVDW